MNMLLIGLRGAGKSTLGAAVADRLNQPFVELDQVTLTQLGASSVAEVWRTHGETVFRQAEVDALRQALRRDGQVIAAGGGAPTAPGAEKLIKNAQRDRRALVIYLRAEPAELRRRLQRDEKSEDRPSLTGADPIDEIERVFAQRDALYRDLANKTLPVDARPDDVLDRLESLGRASRPD